MISSRFLLIPGDDAMSLPGDRDYTIDNYTHAQVFHDNADTITALPNGLTTITAGTHGNHTFFAPRATVLLITTDDFT